MRKLPTSPKMWNYVFMCWQSTSTVQYKAHQRIFWQRHMLRRPFSVFVNHKYNADLVKAHIVRLLTFSWCYLYVLSTVTTLLTCGEYLEVNAHMLISWCDHSQPACSAEKQQKWQNQWPRPEFTYRNILMWPRLSRPTWALGQRYCWSDSPDFAGAMQRRAPGTQRRPCADATKGNREHQTHLHKEHPHWRPEATPTPTSPVCLCACICFVWLFNDASVCVSLYRTRAVDPVSLPVPHRVLSIISSWRSWWTAEQRKLNPVSAACPASERRYSGPRTGPITRLSGDSPEPWVGLVCSLMIAGGWEWPPRMRNNVPYTYRVCLLSRFSHSCQLSLHLLPPPPPPLLLSLPHLFYSLLILTVNRRTTEEGFIRNSTSHSHHMNRTVSRSSVGRQCLAHAAEVWDHKTNNSVRVMLFRCFLDAGSHSDERLGRPVVLTVWFSGMTAGWGSTRWAVVATKDERRAVGGLWGGWSRSSSTGRC